MDFEELREIIINHQEDEDKICLKWTENYDSHDWVHHSTLETGNDDPQYVSEIYIYRCKTCGIYLDLTSWPYPSIEDFTGHRGFCDEEIKTCREVVMLKALK